MMQATNPRQTVIVSCRNTIKKRFSGEEQEYDNLITLDWHMPCSFDPMMYAIAVGKSRYSNQMIKESKVFVVNFLPLEMQKLAVFCGRHSGEHKDKVKESGIEVEPTDTIDCFRLKDALAYLECEVIQVIDAGDHDIFLAKVNKLSEAKHGRRLFHMQLDTFTTTRD